MSTDENEKSEKRTKKEKVIHTRITESLDDEIRDHASRLGISVSNLVRNVLQNAVGLVGDIVADSTSIALSQRAAHQDNHVKTDVSTETHSPDPEVLGWQEAILNLNAICDTCNTILPKGTRAAVGITNKSATRAFRCLTCLEQSFQKEPTHELDPSHDQ